MKKLLLGSIALTAFSISITLIQISCQKPANAQAGNNPYVLPPATTSALGGVIVGQGLNVTNTGVLSASPSSYTLPAATNTAMGGVIVGSGLTVSNTGVLSANSSTTSDLTQQNVLLISTGTLLDQKYVLVNYDGTNERTIPISLPPGRILNGGDGKLSPDAKTLFFGAYESSTDTRFIYSCQTDGTNLKVIHSNTTTNYFSIIDAY